MFIIYIFFLLCILLSVAMILWPSVFSLITIKYYRLVLRMLGYKIEVMPIAPGRPEKIIRIWGFISALFFIIMLQLIYLLPKR